MNCPRRILIAALFLPVVLALAGSVACAQDESLKPDVNKGYDTQEIRRAVARFESEKRDVVRKGDEIIAACRIEPGMVVADVGAGTGLFTRPFAAKVAPGGKVYAVDVAESFVEHVKQTCREQGIDNVVCILSTPTSATLPPESTDLVFTCDTYHHFEYPLKMLASIRGALRPGGRLIIVDRKGAGGHVRADQEKVKKEVTSAGFRLVGESEATERHYLMSFEKTRRFAQPAETLDVWPGEAPGEKGDVAEEKAQPPRNEKSPVTRVTNVTRPTIAVYKPAERTGNGAAVLICPGGGYNILAIDKEG